MTRTVLAALATAVTLAIGGYAIAQQGVPGGAEEVEQLAAVAPPAAAPSPTPATAATQGRRGQVTNLPLPRYVSLKTAEGNARRGPGLSHRIDWLFTRVGMPLRVTAEYENWRRVEDAEGAGGWVHYALLSGARSVLIDRDMAILRVSPSENAEIALYAERGVIARLLSCRGEWCRIAVEGSRAWAPRDTLWGVEPDEVLD